MHLLGILPSGTFVFFCLFVAAVDDCDMFGESFLHGLSLTIELGFFFLCVCRLNLAFLLFLLVLQIEV